MNLSIKYFFTGIAIFIVMVSSVCLEAQTLDVKKYTITNAIDSVVYDAPVGTDYNYLMMTRDIDSGSYSINWSAWVVWKGINLQKEKTGTITVNSYKGSLNENWIGTEYSTRIKLFITKGFNKKLDIYIITKTK